METDRILQTFGKCSRFQILIFSLVCFVTMRGVWHMLSISFIGGSVDHHCYIPEYLEHLNDSQLSALKGCKMYTNISLTHQEICNQWQYPSNYSLTITQQWNLVCNKDYLIELSSTIFMAGTMTGALLIAPLADLVGRKPVLLTCLWLQTVFGVVLIFIDSYIGFAIFRFILGAFNQVIGLSAYLLVAEVFPARYRAIPSVAIYFFWSVGIMVLALFAYLLPDWKHLQLAVSLPSLITTAYIWILPESIPWLIAKGKYSQVKEVLEFASRVNPKKPTLKSLGNGDVVRLPMVKESECLELIHRTDTPNTSQLYPQTMKDHIGIRNHSRPHERAIPVYSDNQPSTVIHKYSALDLFRTPRIRIYTLIMFYLWFVNSLVYFGVMYAIPKFNGNIYLNTFLSGCVEIPAYIIILTVLQVFGRRRPVCLFMFLCGLSCLGYVFTPHKLANGVDITWLKTTLIMISKFAITGSYATIFLYAAEIYPTIIRNQGLGLSAFFENIGGIISPFIAYSAKYYVWLPMTISGSLTMIGALLCLFLPETHRKPLPVTVDDIENLNSQKASASHCR